MGLATKPRAIVAARFVAVRPAARWAGHEEACPGGAGEDLDRLDVCTIASGRPVMRLRSLVATVASVRPTKISRTGPSKSSSKYRVRGEQVVKELAGVCGGCHAGYS
jgi:hypothetical protein